MSDEAGEIARLRAQLENAVLQTDKAEQRAVAAKKEVELERQKTQKTTFKEFIGACHNRFHMAIRVETDKT